MKKTQHEHNTNGKHEVIEVLEDEKIVQYDIWYCTCGMVAARDRRD